MMTTFAIMTPPDNPSMDAFQAALHRVFDGNFVKVGDGQYLGAKPNWASGQVAEAMGINGEVGQYIVITSAGWGGWHQNSVWEWMRIQDRQNAT